MSFIPKIIAEAIFLKAINLTDVCCSKVRLNLWVCYLFFCTWTFCEKVRIIGYWLFYHGKRKGRFLRVLHPSARVRFTGESAEDSFVILYIIRACLLFIESRRKECTVVDRRCDFCHLGSQGGRFSFGMEFISISGQGHVWSIFIDVNRVNFAVDINRCKSC